MQNKETSNQKRDILKNVTLGCHSNNPINAQLTGKLGKNKHSRVATKQPQKTNTMHAQGKDLHMVTIRFLWILNSISYNMVGRYQNKHMGVGGNGSDYG